MGEWRGEDLFTALIFSFFFLFITRKIRRKIHNYLSCTKNVTTLIHPFENGMNYKDVKTNIWHLTLIHKLLQNSHYSPFFFLRPS